MVCSKLGYLQWWATKSCWFWMGIFKIARTQFLRNVQDILPLGFVYFQLYADMTCIHNTYTLTFENKWFHSATLLGFGLFRTTCSNKKRVHLLWGHESGPPGFIMFHPPKTSFLPDPGMWSRWFWSRGADLSLRFCCILSHVPRCAFLTPCSEGRHMLLALHVLWLMMSMSWGQFRNTKVSLAVKRTLCKIHPINDNKEQPPM